MTEKTTPDKTTPEKTTPEPALTQAEPAAPAARGAPKLPKEIGGAKGPEPTRYGDWEHKGRCTDF